MGMKGTLLQISESSSVYKKEIVLKSNFNTTSLIIIRNLLFYRILSAALTKASSARMA